ncbi:hypothetical protein N431DRAFT_500115 [Stipitochalara longipes BDJ]|nr:hypothetical protein N431DRAFT_500115 [Stipitochalara longipes BDJ]
MGRGSHRRNRRVHHDELDLPSPNLLFQRSGPSAYTPPSSPSAPPSPSVDSNSNLGAKKPFQRCRQRPQQNRPALPWQQCNKQSRCFPPEPQNRHIFLQKSLRLKQNLVRTFTQALQQIEQWYPDENPDGDLMDWQPEDEFVIPQQDNIMYTYGQGAMQRGETGYARDEIKESRLDYCHLGRHRAASDVGVSRTLGCSAAEARWCGTTGQTPEPESVSPLSDDLGSNYGIA